MVVVGGGVGGGEGGVEEWEEEWRNGRRMRLVELGTLE